MSRGVAGSGQSTARPFHETIVEAIQVEVDFETLKVGEEILVDGERCKLGQYSVSKFVMILTGPKEGYCLEKYPGPKDKVQKIIKKGSEKMAVAEPLTPTNSLGPNVPVE